MRESLGTTVTVNTAVSTAKSLAFFVSACWQQAKRTTIQKDKQAVLEAVHHSLLALARGFHVNLSGSNLFFDTFWPLISVTCSR